MHSKIKVGQLVRHADFRGLGTVAHISEDRHRVSADFLGTNGIIDDAHHFKIVIRAEKSETNNKGGPSGRQQARAK